MSRKALHWSDLKWMATSPAHYKYYLSHPLDPTPAMRIGSMAHKLLLGGPRYFTVFPGKVRNGKKWEEFKRDAEQARLEIVSKTEMETAEAVCEALKADTQVKELMEGAEHEVPLAWKIGNRRCAGIADILNPKRILADLKVTGSADPRWFRWHAKKMQYREQMAWYYDGLPSKPAVVSIIAAEAKPPYPVVVYDLTDADLDYGRRQYHLLLNQLQVYEENNHWPGYVEGICLLDIPDDEPLDLTVGGEEMVL